MHGKLFSTPSRCVNKRLFGMWGEFDVDDQSCAQRGGTYIVFDPPPARPVVAIAATPSGQGYWLAGMDGAIYTFGDAVAYGPASGVRSFNDVVALAVSPTGKGYWLASSAGPILSFGDAADLGSPPSRRAASPIVSIASSPSGKGYWAVAKDGSLFAFGDAPNLGSVAIQRGAKPIVGIACTPSGKGYWLASADGTIYSFGDANTLGSMTGTALFRPVVALARTSTGNGYTLAAADSGIYTFGDAEFHGSYGGFELTYPVVAAALTPDGRGYWLVDDHGGVYPFGNAWVGWKATLGGQGAPGFSERNDVDVIVDGEALFSQLVSAIRAARSTVSFLQLVMEPDFLIHFSPPSTLSDELVAADRRKVVVRGIVDRIVSLRYNATAPLLNQRFREQGARSIRIRDIALWEPGRQHAKAIIIDGQIAFVLGATFQESMWDSPAHPVDDTVHRKSAPLHTVSFKVAGPAAADIERMFIEAWNRVDRLDNQARDQLQPGAPVPGSGRQSVQILRTLPRDHTATDTGPITGEVAVLEAYQRAFANAQHFIYLEHQYLTCRPIVEAVRNAMDTHPGLRVILVLNQKPDIPGYQEWQDQLIQQRLGYPNPQLGVFAMWSVGPLRGVGRRDIRNIYVEGKVAIIDDQWLTLGTANLDGISLAHFETPDNPYPLLPFHGLYSLLGSKRSMELNGAFFDGLEGLAATGICGRVRTALWQEQLGLAAGALVEAPPGGWLEIWRTIAGQNVKSLSRQSPGMQGHILPWAPGDKGDARSHLEKIGVDVSHLVVRD